MRSPFEAWDLRDLAQQLAAQLEARRAKAEPAASRLHTERVSEHVCEVSVYGTSNDYPRQHQVFGKAFASWERFLEQLRDESPGAIEVAIDLLSRIDPRSAMPIALAIFERRPWNLLWDAAARALSRCDDERAFRALLENASAYGVGRRMRMSEYRGGLELALETLAQDPLLVPDLLAYLGKLRAERGFAVLAKHWQAAPGPDTGHPLLGWRDARSLDLLEAGVRDQDRWRRFFGVAAYLARDPARVIERLGGHAALTEPRNVEVAAEVLEQIGKRLLSKRPADEPLERHPSYLELARAWVKEKPTKNVAQWVINAFPTSISKPPKKRKAPDGSLATMRATMTTARGNLERIAARLKKHGYVFVRPRGVLSNSTAASKRALERLEKAVGPLPAAMRAAYEIIVGCDLRGSHPAWPRFASLEVPGAKEPIWYTDPFVLVPAASLVGEAEDHAGDEAAYTLAFAPDDAGKAGYSGGIHSVDVPGASDPIVEGAPLEGSFVAYLREVFEWGGFPGFARIKKGRPQPLIDELRALCEPI